MTEIRELFEKGKIITSGEVLFTESEWLYKCSKCEKVIDLKPLKEEVFWVDDDVDWGITCPYCKKWLNFYCPVWDEQNKEKEEDEE